jgi:hypothetical protein
MPDRTLITEFFDEERSVFEQVIGKIVDHLSKTG